MLDTINKEMKCHFICCHKKFIIFIFVLAIISLTSSVKLCNAVQLKQISQKSNYVSLLYFEESRSKLQYSGLEFRNTDELIELSNSFDFTFYPAFFMHHKAVHGGSVESVKIFASNGTYTWNIEIFSDNTILINYKYYASGIIFNKKSDLIDRVKLLFLD